MQRVTDRRGLQHVFDGDLVLEVRERVPRAVVVVLHSHRREHFSRRAELVHVSSGERCEQHGRCFSPSEDRVTGSGAGQETFLR